MKRIIIAIIAVTCATLLISANVLATDFSAADATTSVSTFVEAPSATSPAVTSMVEFRHKCNSAYDTTMKLSRLKNLAKMLPNNLRKEIAEQYYPTLRKGLTTQNEMKFLKAEVTKEDTTDEIFTVNLSFPKFNLTLRDVTWAELDKIFYQYIAPRTSRQVSAEPFPESTSVPSAE